MRRRTRKFSDLLTRSLAVSGLVYALVAAYLVPATLLAEPALTPPDGASSFSHTWTHPEWRAAYAARFPGCVGIEEWTDNAVPATVVVVQRSGELTRMDFDDAYERSRTESHADDVWTVGGCP